MGSSNANLLLITLKDPNLPVTSLVPLNSSTSNTPSIPPTLALHHVNLISLRDLIQARCLPSSMIHTFHRSPTFRLPTCSTLCLRLPPQHPINNLNFPNPVPLRPILIRLPPLLLAPKTHISPALCFSVGLHLNPMVLPSSYPPRSPHSHSSQPLSIVPSLTHREVMTRNRSRRAIRTRTVC